MVLNDINISKYCLGCQIWEKIPNKIKCIWNPIWNGSNKI